jgi:hypothetical protein
MISLILTNSIPKKFLYTKLVAAIRWKEPGCCGVKNALFQGIQGKKESTSLFPMW